MTQNLGGEVADDFSSFQHECNVNNECELRTLTNMISEPFVDNDCFDK